MGDILLKWHKCLPMTQKKRSHKWRKLTNEMIMFIREKITKLQWSPQQIKGYCDANNIPMVSVEWIYHYIKLDKANGGTLYKHQF